MKVFTAVFLASATLTQIAVCRADTLKGSKITGVLYADGDTSKDDFDHTGGRKKAAKATIGPGVEFRGISLLGDAGDCSYSVNFSASKVAITDKCSGVVAFAEEADAKKLGHLHDNFEMSFTDPALAGDMITPISNGLGLTYDATVVGDTITFDLTEGYSDTNRSTFAITTAVTPEPASWQLLGLGLAGMVGVASIAKQQTAKDASVVSLG